MFEDVPFDIAERSLNTERDFASRLNIRLAFSPKNSTERLSCVGRMLA